MNNGGRRENELAAATTATIELADLKPPPAEATTTLNNDYKLHAANNSINTTTTTTIVTIPINNNLKGEQETINVNSIEPADDDGEQESKSKINEDTMSVSRRLSATLTIAPAIPPQQQENIDEIITTSPENHTTTISILPGTPSTSTQRQLFKDAAALHGGDAATDFLQHELTSALQQQQQILAQNKQRTRTASSTLDAATVSRNPSAVGGGGGKHEKKIGHRRVDDGGEVTYKKIQSKQIMGSIQLGIQYTVSSLASKPKRDLLMNDFWEMETISFPADGSTITPAHHYNDFRFKVYAPIAFRYFRDLFGIAPDDFLMSLCASPLRQLSNPGASGSIFYLTDDDEFIIKTVQKKECEFLQKLLPGYYMNLSQNPRTLLPKFFGLYCFNYNAKNVRLVTMNNLLPSDIKMHAKYDLKGSTFRRKASKVERQKTSPTFKDLDFMEHHPNGIFLETDKYNALIKTIQRDCMVLESFHIMDYSLLVGIHNLDIAAKEKREERIRNARAKLQRHDEIRGGDASDEYGEMEQMQAGQGQQQQQAQQGTVYSTPQATGGQAAGTALNRTRSINRQRLVAHSTAMESITADMQATIDEDEDVPAGGIPARSENDERLILYIGIIDILQSYRLEKKLEHTFKSIIYNGDTVSVCRPSFYAQRFQTFMSKTVFKKTPTFPLKHSPSKRKTSTATTATASSLRTPQRTPSQSIGSPSMRPFTHLSGMSTPPPAFDDISEEDITATSSTAFARNFNVNSNSKFMPTRSYLSSNRSVLSSATSDYSDDEMMPATSSAMITPRHSFVTVQTPPPSTSRTSTTSAVAVVQARSPTPTNPRPQSPRLTKTNVLVASIGGRDELQNQLDQSQQQLQRLLIVEETKTPNGVESGDEGELENEEGKALLHSKDQRMMDDGDKNIEINGIATKTMIINNSTTTQTYTSTLVVNEVSR